jgi:hypothetical protein
MENPHFFLKRLLIKLIFLPNQPQPDKRQQTINHNQLNPDFVIAVLSD